MKGICDNDFQQDRRDLFWWFVYERHSIWVRRCLRNAPPPWTQDPIMQRERFTNVYRELDPGTRYVLAGILEIDAPKPDKIFNTMLYRLIGRATTHAVVGFQHLQTFAPADLEWKLKTLRAEGKPVFTSAYLVSGYTSMGSRDKVENVVRLFSQLSCDFTAFCARLTAAESAAEAYEAIRSRAGFGNFLAYQVLVDLLYSLRAYGGRAVLPHSNDDWASAGPGAKRGIALLVRSSSRVDELAVMRWLRDNQREEFERLGLIFPYARDSKGNSIPISLANIQNCLCEFHKYVKIRDGTGRGRRRFVPTPLTDHTQLALGLSEGYQP